MKPRWRSWAWAGADLLLCVWLAWNVPRHWIYWPDLGWPAWVGVVMGLITAAGSIWMGWRTVDHVREAWKTGGTA